MKSRFSLFLGLVLVGALSVAAAADKKKASAPAAGDAKAGEEVFAKQCAVCHNADSTEAKLGPGLKGLFKSDKLPSGKPTDEKTVTERINKGSDKMPAFEKKISKKELADLIAYLKTL